MRVGSLFAGIGGFDVAAEALGWRTVWLVEWNPACQFWLGEHFPGRPIYGDITQVNFSEVEAVDVLCGGFPCQPASAAGRRRGKLDERWLWPEFARAVRDLRPRYVVVENVTGLLSLCDGVGQSLAGAVLGDLAALGYDAEWRVLSAADVGADHERERVWIVAYVDDAARGRREQHHAGERGEALADARRVPVGDAARERPQGNGRPVEYAGERVPRAAGVQLRQWDSWVAVEGADGTVRRIPREAADAGPQSALWPVADGIPGRVARLSAVGNAVVPACALEAFRIIEERERVNG